jgi:hypothetical protein
MRNLGAIVRNSGIHTNLVTNFRMRKLVRKLVHAPEGGAILEHWLSQGLTRGPKY